MAFSTPADQLLQSRQWRQTQELAAQGVLRHRIERGQSVGYGATKG
jgi:hypothetical protein